MTTTTVTTLETLARASWYVWGRGYALYTRCSGCGDVKHCRGNRRDGMLCLECFDLGGAS